ncbi:MAG: hypothetical protein IJA26_03685 [Clostridia bacterium]|nr:hypothetical protein [Clostridia bacterium]
MYELNARWNSYYSEHDPVRRREMLEELFASEEDDGANMYRLQLWDVRHSSKTGSPAETDRLLFQFVNMVQVYRSFYLFKSGAAKEVRKIFRDLHFTEAAHYGAAGEQALYWEIRNAAMRYFKTCEGSSYNRALFGMIPSREKGKRERACGDVWQMTYGVERRTGLAEEIRIWKQAVLDSYYVYENNAQAMLEAFEIKESGKTVKSRNRL